MGNQIVQFISLPDLVHYVHTFFIRPSFIRTSSLILIAQIDMNFKKFLWEF